MRAIDSYYKLKGKITDKVDLTTKGKQLPITLNIIKPEQNET